MRKGFEQNLRQYSSDITAKASPVHKKEKKRLRNLGRAQDKKLEELTVSKEIELDDDLQALDEQLEDKLLEASESQHVNEVTRAKLYSLQIQKQLVMEHLRHDMACLDNPDCSHEKTPEERIAKYNENDNSFTYIDDKNNQRRATFGEIITDVDFGIYYDLDTETVPRDASKKYILAKAKSELRELLDQQIIVSEMNNEEVDELKKEAYENIQLSKNDGFYEKNPAFVSEMVVKNYLKQLSIDKSLPFEVVEADVYQDVEHKMDFIIHRKDDFKAAKVVSDTESGEIKIVPDVAIQFSLDSGKRSHKLKQINNAEKKLEMSEEKIKSIALVIFPEVKARNLNDKWKKDGKPAGGPGKYMDTETRHQLFQKLLSELFEEREVGDMWEKAQS